MQGAFRFESKVSFQIICSRYVRFGLSVIECYACKYENGLVRAWLRLSTFINVKRDEASAFLDGKVLGATLVFPARFEEAASPSRF